MVACNSHQTTPRSRARDQLSQYFIGLCLKFAILSREPPYESGVVPDDHRALLYRPVESLGDAIRTDDLETAKRYRDQLNVFFVAPYATTGEPLGDAVAELYKVSGWWLRNFHARPEHKQQALLSVERVIGLLDA